MSVNLGYFGGARYAYDQYLIDHKNIPDWIIVSNVDIVIKDEDFVNKLDNFLTFPELGIIAPSIISNKWQTDTNPKIISRYSRRKMTFYKIIYRFCVIHNAYILVSYIKKILYRLLIKKKQNTSSTDYREIYAPHGSAIIFHINYFNKGGTLNHISFLFGEEIFVAESARNIQLKVVYAPEIQVYDFEHASTGFFYSKKICKYMSQSTTDILEYYY
jgi:hypothetical protein